MRYSLKKEDWKKSKVVFEVDEEILCIVDFHKRPNVVQMYVYRAFSPILADRYLIMLTNKRIIVIPYNNRKLFNIEPIFYLGNEDVRLMRSDGALELTIEGKKPLRVYPDSLYNKLKKADLDEFISILRRKQQN